MVTFSSNIIAVTMSGLQHLRIMQLVAWVKKFIVIGLKKFSVPSKVPGPLKQIARSKKYPLRIGNDNISAWLISVVLRAVMLLWLGIGILPCFIIQMLIAITLLEAVNYLGHYGMLRQKVKSEDRDRYKRVDPSHRWNSDNIATNVLLYHLQRHSDHHAQPTRRYQALLSTR